MTNRVVYIHGNQTPHWTFAWAPWLKSELENLGFTTFFETMPDSIIARKKYWLPFLKDHVRVGKDDILVGWSSGAIAAMRFAEDYEIKGSVLVSPSCTDLDDELEKASGYFDDPWKWDAIRENQKRIELISGNDDPFIPQNEFSTIAENLQPNWTKLSIGGHFIDQSEFPEVLQAVQRIAAD